MKNLETEYEKAIESFWSKHKVIDCLVCQFLKETGYSPKEIKVVRSFNAGNLETTFTVAHKNTPNKYL